MSRATGETLSMITGGQTLRLQRSTGGHAELSSDDVRAALGFVDYDGKMNGVPENRIGMHIVLARYTDDKNSHRILRAYLAEMLWIQFWNFCQDESARVTKKTFVNLADTLVDDYCHPGRFRNASDKAMARKIGMATHVWRVRFKRLYGSARGDLARLEGPVMKTLARVIG